MRAFLLGRFHESNVCVIVPDSKMGACMFGYKLLRSRVVALWLAGLYRVFLILFGVDYWYDKLSSLLYHCGSKNQM